MLSQQGVDVATVVQVAICVIGLITTCLVPWAYIMERRLARIESRLSNGVAALLEHHDSRLIDIDKRLREIELVCARQGGIRELRSDKSSDS